MRLGIDLGGTHLRTFSAGTFAESATPDGYAALLARLRSFGAAELAIGVPGATGPSVVSWVPALPWLDGRPLARDLSPARAVLANDAHLALLGEAREGAAVGLRDAVLVSVGTGIGGAILHNGRIVRGHTGTAGAFGWLPALGAAATDAHGGFELAASGRALDRLAASAAPGGRNFAEVVASAGPGGRNFAEVAPGFSGGPALVDAARAGDPRAIEVLHGWAATLGAGLGAIASILDPQRIVLSGGLCEAFDTYAEPLLAAVANTASPGTRGVEIVPAALGVAAGAIGAWHAASGEDQW